MPELPETNLIRKTVVLREMDLPPQVHLTKRSMLRWFALSFGLLNEQESRVTVLHILDTLFYYLFTEKKNPTTMEIKHFMRDHFKINTSEKLIRYHINKLIDLHLLTRKQNKYHINHHPYGDRDDFVASFDYWVKQSTEKSLANIQTVVGKMVDNYNTQKPIEPVKQPESIPEKPTDVLDELNQLKPTYVTPQDKREIDDVLEEED